MRPEVARIVVELAGYDAALVALDGRGLDVAQMLADCPALQAMERQYPGGLEALLGASRGDERAMVLLEAMTTWPMDPTRQ